MLSTIITLCSPPTPWQVSRTAVYTRKHYRTLKRINSRGTVHLCELFHVFPCTWSILLCLKSFTQYSMVVQQRLQCQLQLNITIYEVFPENVPSRKMTIQETPFRESDHPGIIFSGNVSSGGKKTIHFPGNVFPGKKPSGESNHLANDRIPSCLLSSHWRQFSILLGDYIVTNQLAHLQLCFCANLVETLSLVVYLVCLQLMLFGILQQNQHHSVCYPHLATAARGVI